MGFIFSELVSANTCINWSLARSSVSLMAVESTEVAYVIRRYHVYQNVWIPEIGEVLEAEVERENLYDKYAVAIVHADHAIVGHVPMKILKLCSCFLSRRGTIQASVMGE